MKARNISNNTTEVTLAAMEDITISSSEDDPDDPGEWISAQSDAEVSESSGDEGGNDLYEGETEKGEPQKGDYRVDPDDVPGLQDESEEENEAPPGLEADESSSIGNKGTLEQIQYQLRDLMKIMEPKEVLGRLFSIVSDPLEYRRWSLNRILIS